MPNIPATEERYIARPPDAPWHGTSGGYTNHSCRCRPCTDAHSAVMYRRKQRRKTEPVPEHVHGTPNGYGNYGCRCRPCTDAWTRDTVARTKRREERRKAEVE